MQLGASRPGRSGLTRPGRDESDQTRIGSTSSGSRGEARREAKGQRTTWQEALGSALQRLLGIARLDNKQHGRIDKVGLGVGCIRHGRRHQEKPVETPLQRARQVWTGRDGHRNTTRGLTWWGRPDDTSRDMVRWRSGLIRWGEAGAGLASSGRQWLFTAGPRSGVTRQAWRGSGGVAHGGDRIRSGAVRQARKDPTGPGSTLYHKALPGRHGLPRCSKAHKPRSVG